LAEFKGAVRKVKERRVAVPAAGVLLQMHQRFADERADRARGRTPMRESSVVAIVWSLSIAHRSDGSLRQSAHLGQLPWIVEHPTAIFVNTHAVTGGFTHDRAEAGDESQRVADIVSWQLGERPVVDRGGLFSCRRFELLAVAHHASLRPE